MVIKIGSQVKYVGSTQKAPRGYQVGTTGVVVGYWCERDFDGPWFSLSEEAGDFEVPYPYYVRGLVPDDEDQPDENQAIFGEDELEVI